MAHPIKAKTLKRKITRQFIIRLCTCLNLIFHLTKVISLLKENDKKAEKTIKVFNLNDKVLKRRKQAILQMLIVCVKELIKMKL